MSGQFHPRARCPSPYLPAISIDMLSSFNPWQVARKKRPVGHRPKAKKGRIELDINGAVSKECQQWVKLKAKYNKACLYTYCGMRATGTPRGISKKHRGTHSAEKKCLEAHEYIAATGMNDSSPASKEFDIPTRKLTIQEAKNNDAKGS